MSAYGNSDEIREGQINMLVSDMEKEYKAGNYVLCGGDFNHDLKASEDDSETGNHGLILFQERNFQVIFLSA